VTLEENMKKLASVPLLFHPGERWEYGMSTDVLGRVVEVVSGMTLDRFFEGRIFRPLGMRDTAFKVSPEQRERIVAVYIPVEGGVQKLKDGEIVKHDPDSISADYPYAESHNYRSGGGDLCSTPSDYMRFCQMLLNGGHFDGGRLLEEDTVRLMTTNKLGDSPFKFGFGFTIFPDSDDVHEQLRGAYAWFGYWSTSFRIAPRGDWILVTMSQVAWQKKVTPAWFREYERIAAEAIEKQCAD
jgi:CubicO group peptidase (beta-lactamase class C family)